MKYIVLVFCLLFLFSCDDSSDGPSNSGLNFEGRLIAQIPINNLLELSEEYPEEDISFINPKSKAYSFDAFDHYLIEWKNNDEVIFDYNFYDSLGRLGAYGTKYIRSYNYKTNNSNTLVNLDSLLISINERLEFKPTFMAQYSTSIFKGDLYFSDQTDKIFVLKQDNSLVTIETQNDGIKHFDIYKNSLLVSPGFLSDMGAVIHKIENYAITSSLEFESYLDPLQELIIDGNKGYLACSFSLGETQTLMKKVDLDMFTEIETLPFSPYVSPRAPSSSRIEKRGGSFVFASLDSNNFSKYLITFNPETEISDTLKFNEFTDKSVIEDGLLIPIYFPYNSNNIFFSYAYLTEEMEYFTQDYSVKFNVDGSDLIFNEFSLRQINISELLTDRSFRALKWSPDGSKLAVIQEKSIYENSRELALFLNIYE